MVQFREAFLLMHPKNIGEQFFARLSIVSRGNQVRSPLQPSRPHVSMALLRCMECGEIPQQCALL